MGKIVKTAACFVRSTPQPEHAATEQKTAPGAPCSRLAFNALRLAYGLLHDGSF
jgi:hypothetical protein